jgi:hypothetical protein
VIRVDPNERRIGLSLKELAHAIEMTQVEERGGGGQGQGRRGRRGKQRADYDYDDDE